MQALEEIRAALLAGHMYDGLCPDQVEGLEVRDPLCAACQALIALDTVIGARPASLTPAQIAEAIIINYCVPPINVAELEQGIAQAIAAALAVVNLRALDIQYALDAEYRAHQPIRIDSGELPAEYTNALWHRRGVGWQSGSLCWLPNSKNAEHAVMLPHGTKIPLSSFTHWLPAPGDPTLPPPPAE